MPAALSLKDRHAIVQSLWSAVNDGGAALEEVPRIVKTLLTSGAWKERELPTGRVARYADNEFRKFIETPPLEGCGWPPDKVAKLLVGDADVEALWRLAITPPAHVHHADSDNVTITRGNSRAYTLGRLRGERPDLFAEVVAKRMTANAAALQAGFRKRLTALDKLDRAWAEASEEERSVFLRKIAG